MMRWEAPPSFADYVRDRHVGLLKFAYVLTGSQSLAQDLVQDALERTGTSWRKIRRDDDPEGYVRRIITNRYLNRLRALKREVLVDAVPSTAAVAHHPGEQGELWGLLGELPPAQRAVIVLRFYLDMSDADIAGLVGCSTGTVRSNATRAMANLRKLLAADTDASISGWAGRDR